MRDVITYKPTGQSWKKKVYSNRPTAVCAWAYYFWHRKDFNDLSGPVEVSWRSEKRFATKPLKSLREVLQRNYALSNKKR